VRILADENVEQPVIERLRLDGYDVVAVAIQTPGALDPSVLAQAVHEDVLLLTADRDFGDYVYRDHLAAPSAGIALYRLGHNLSTPEKAQIISDAMSRHANDFAAHFAVIEEGKVRFRPLP
jgi:predicted nuclease of predicted toxin-antitoxin system